METRKLPTRLVRNSKTNTGFWNKNQLKTILGLMLIFSISMLQAQSPGGVGNPDGTVAKPFTNLGEARTYVSADGTYNFNIDGESFSTFVSADGWVLLASNDETIAQTALSISTSVTKASNTILSAAAFGELTDATEVRIHAERGTNAGLVDAISTNATVLSRLVAFEAFGRRNNTALSSQWTGTLGTFFNGGNCNTAATTGGATNYELSHNMIHNCGNGNGIHWIPGAALSNVNNSQTGSTGFNLFGRAPAVTPELKLWLKANSGTNTQVNGSAVETWTDQSGNGFVAQQQDAIDNAVFTDNGANFNPVLRFDENTSRGFELTTALFDQAADLPAIGLEAFYVINNIGDASSGGQIMMNGTGNNNRFYLMNNGGRFGSTANPSFINESGPHLISTQYDNVDGNGTGSTARTINNGNEDTRSGNDWDTIQAGQPWAIGHHAQGDTTGRRYDGDIAELIIYNTLIPAERLKVQSYLALKYGITLATTDQGYLSSQGTNIYSYDVLPGQTEFYFNDVFGIGRDTASDLDQQISKSVNAGTILTVSTNSNFTVANGTRPSLADGQFLVIGNNGGATTTQSTETPAGQNLRVTREWRVENTGAVPSTNIFMQFEGFDDTWTLYSDTDGDFADATAIGNLSASGIIGRVALTDGMHLTLAKSVATPGGVSADLALWLKADTGVFSDGDGTAVGTNDALEGESIGSWDDVSGNENYFFDGPSNNPVFRENIASLNFNPAVSLEAVNQGLLTDFSVDSRPYTFFTVYTYEGFDYRGQLFSADSGSVNWGVGAAGGPGSEGFNSGASGGATYQTLAANQPLNQARIGVSQTTTTNSAFFLNGEDVTTNANPGIAPGKIGFGAENTFNNAMQGDAAEMIYFDRILSLSERQQVESYLALKYGVTLRQNGGGGLNTQIVDYLASDESLIWSTAKSYEQIDAGGGFFLDKLYAFNVFGIGRDDASGLNQKVATSVNSDAVLSVALDADFTNANNDATRTTNHTNDLQFITFGHDGFDNDTRTVELDPATGFNVRLNREWKTQRSANMTQNITLKFEGRGGWSLITVATGEDFSSGVTTVGQLNANGEITVTAAQLPDSSVFTLAFDSLLQAIGTDAAAGNNTYTTGTTAAEYNALTGVSGAVATNEAAYLAAIAANEGPFSNPATEAEVQTMINAVNASIDALTEVLEDSDSTDGANNANSTAVTAAQLAAITGIENVVPANEAAYQAAINAETGFSNLPTLAEVQAIIDAVNVETIVNNANDPADGNPSEANLTEVGVTGVETTSVGEYEEAIANANPAPTTLAELQEVVDAVNANTDALTEVLEDSDSTDGANNANGTAVTAAQLASISGVSNVDPNNEEAYQTLINAETGFSNLPTVAEIQAIIDEANNVATAVAASSPNTLTQAQLTSAGITQTGLTQEELDVIATAVAAESPAPISTAELQAIVDTALDALGTTDNTLAVLKMYPNPAKSQVVISTNVNKVTLHNIQGQKVLETSNNTFDVSRLQSGVYMVTIETDKGLTVRRLVKE